MQAALAPKTTAKIESLYGLSHVAERSSKQEVAQAASDAVAAFDHFQSLKKQEIELIAQTADLNLRYSELLDKQQEESSGSGNPRTIADRASTIGSMYTDLVFGEDKEIDIVEHRLHCAHIQAGAIERQLENFNDDYLNGNVINLGVFRSETSSLTSSLARGDLAIMLHSFSDLLETDKLKELHELALASNKPDIDAKKRNALLNEISTKTKSYLEQHQTILETDNRAKEISDLIRSNKLDDAINLSNQYFKPYTETATYQRDIASITPYIERFEVLSSESLNEIGIRTSAPSNLLDENADILSQLSDAELKALSPREARIAIETKSRLWDNRIDWEQDIVGQADAQLLTTSYATLKRISELSSAFDSSLLEASNQNIPEELKADSRKEVINKFWGRFFETKNFIQTEMISEALRVTNHHSAPNSQANCETVILALTKSYLNDPENQNHKSLISAMLNQSAAGRYPISNDVFNIVRNSLSNEDNATSMQQVLESLNSLGISSGYAENISNEISNVLNPYQGLLAAVNIIDANEVLSLYTPEVLQSHEKTFQQTILAVNPVFQQISSYLKATNAHGAQIKPTLDQLRELNQNHPEISKINSWIDAFPKRYSKVLN